MTCFVAGRVKDRECYGAITRHHIVPKAKIRKRFPHGAKVNPVTGPYYLPRLSGEQEKAAVRLPQIVADTRNLIGVCFGCHVGLVETGNPDARVQFDDLPDGFWDFVGEYGFAAVLPRHLAERWAA